MQFRPEILDHPLLLLLDVGIDFQEALATVAPHSNVDIVQVPRSLLDQRERMLSSFVFLAPWLVKTRWMLKLDTDCFAVRANSDWCDAKQIAPNEEGQEPVLWAGGWGYTKPANAIKTLDDWGDTVQSLRIFPRLDLPFDPKARAVTTPGRIISYVFFGNVSWLKWASELCCRLPVPSQDTYLWYLAKRCGRFYRTSRMHRLGWEHRGRMQVE